MAFSEDVKSRILLRSQRYCVLCAQHAGRDGEIHHIVAVADGGTDAFDNAILLCSRCHGEAGHYNPRHPRGTKYAPTELRQRRDMWYVHVEAGYSAESRPEWHTPLVGSGRGVPVRSVEIGVYWSRRSDISEWRDTIEFDGESLASARRDYGGRHEYELFRRPDGTFLVHVTVIASSGDYCHAYLDGTPAEVGGPRHRDRFVQPPLRHDRLELSDLHEKYGDLAAAAGLKRVRRLS